MMFQEKAVIVTGAASGIGAAAAMRFAQEEAAMLLVDRNEAGASAVADRISAFGGKALTLAADIGEDADNRRMVEHCLERFGRLDAAFLNAGAYAQAAFAEHDTEMFDRMVAINLRGAWLGLKAVAPALAPGGAAVVTASTSGVIGLAVAAAYSAAKHGVIGLVRSASQDFAARGTRVNAICPGPVATAILGATGLSEIVPPESLRPVPHGGVLSPQHIAEIALFLAGPRSSGLNGQHIVADAGYLASYPPMGP